MIFKALRRLSQRESIASAAPQCAVAQFENGSLSHPERSRFSGGAKDLMLNLPYAQAKHYYPSLNLLNFPDFHETKNKDR
jgi:hypothetical protein